MCFDVLNGSFMSQPLFFSVFSEQRDQTQSIPPTGHRQTSRVRSTGDSELPTDVIVSVCIMQS